MSTSFSNSLSSNGIAMPPADSDLPTMLNFIEKGIRVLLQKPGTIPHAQYQCLYAAHYNLCQYVSSRMHSDVGNESGVRNSELLEVSWKYTAYSTRGLYYSCAALYLKLSDFFSKYTSEMVATMDSVESDGFLQSVIEGSDRFDIGAKNFSRIFNLMQPQLIRLMVDEGSKHLLPVITIANVHRRELFFNHIHKLCDGVLKAIERQRMGSDINIGIVKNVVDSLISAPGPGSEVWIPLEQARSDPLFIYRKYLHNPIITATQEYYEATSKHFIRENGVAAYIQWAEKALKDEESFAELCLHATTRDALISTCERLLLIDHLNVLQKEFRPLFESEQEEYLGPLYALLSRVPNGMDFLKDTFRNLVDFDDTRDMQRRYLMMTHIPPQLETLRGAFETHVEEVGYSAVAELLNEGGADIVDSPRIYVDKLLEVRQKNLDIVQIAFGGDLSFLTALDKAYHIFVNRNDATGTSQSKSSEMLVRHLDALLSRRNNQQIDGDGIDIDAELNRSMVLFKYLDDKDIFQTFYNIKLAKRLIYNASVSEHYEITVILKLQEICGVEYTNRMIRIMTGTVTLLGHNSPSDTIHLFLEIDMSKDLTNQFKEHIQGSFPGDSGMNFGISVLGTNFWPLDTETGGFNIPAEMLRTFERFNRFFQAKHSGRKLTWLWKYSNNELRTTFLDCEYILTASSYQTAILLQFNGNDMLSLEDIHVATAQSEETLAQIMGPLVKSKILLQDGVDMFKLNKSMSFFRATAVAGNSATDFRSKKIRINLNRPIKKLAPQSEKVVQDVEKDRKYVIHANIVRLMKANKTMTNQGLIHEVTSQAARWFTPNVPDIKRAIDLLLEKEYIKRAEDANDTFEYVA
ncbi:Cullin-domain-containing protein [Rickenella mellea]|uniref:Cullin-domain-containing protein n=1 Tax=Rickenella mellea TaxID=50990 RepID=A0A4Y7QA75_9AGAM|nr:Cullin-domain-containing protein [Rickenella mellea]